MTIGGTLPRRNPGMFNVLAISAYALYILGLRSAHGTSTVILTRVGLDGSPVLGTLTTPVFMARAATTARGWARFEPRQSYGEVRRVAKPREMARGAPRAVGGRVGVPYTRRRTSGLAITCWAGRPGRSVVAS